MVNHQLISYESLKLYKFWLIRDVLLIDVTNYINYYLYELTKFRLLKPPDINLINSKYIDELGIVFKTEDMLADGKFHHYYLLWNNDKVVKLKLIYRSEFVHISVKVDLKKSGIKDITIMGEYFKSMDFTISNQIQINL